MRELADWEDVLISYQEAVEEGYTEDCITLLTISSNKIVPDTLLCLSRHTSVADAIDCLTPNINFIALPGEGATKPSLVTRNYLSRISHLLGKSATRVPLRSVAIRDVWCESSPIPIYQLIRGFLTRYQDALLMLNEEGIPKSVISVDGLGRFLYEYFPKIGIQRSHEKQRVSSAFAV